MLMLQRVWTLGVRRAGGRHSASAQLMAPQENLACECFGTHEPDGRLSVCSRL